MLNLLLGILDVIVRVVTVIPVILKVLKDLGISTKTVFIVACAALSFYYVDSYRVAQAIFYTEISHSVNTLSTTLTNQTKINTKFMEETTNMLRQHEKDLVALKRAEELMGLPLYSDDKGRTYLQRDRSTN